MYDFLEGEVASRSPARMVLSVAGVGYELAVPLSAALPAHGRTRVWTHMIPRDDGFQLFGFESPSTRDLFRSLLKVRGVGPSTAMGLLSSLSPTELLAAVLAGDRSSLTAVKGVGRKTAEQIMLDLRDRAPALLAALGAPSAGEGPPSLSQNAAAERHNVAQAVSALVSLGFSEAEAHRQVERAAADVDTADLEVLVRAAIQA